MKKQYAYAKSKPRTHRRHSTILKFCSECWFPRFQDRKSFDILMKYWNSWNRHLWNATKTYIKVTFKHHQQNQWKGIMPMQEVNRGHIDGTHTYWLKFICASWYTWFQDRKNIEIDVEILKFLISASMECCNNLHKS